jgi:hypothetical protein
MFTAMTRNGRSISGRRIGLAAAPVVALAALGALAGVAAGAPATGPAPASAPTRATPRALLSSRNLWATVDICATPKQRHTVGIRGSMPGDGEAGDRMFMSFRLQQEVVATGRWRNFGPPGEYQPVGNGMAIRQAGTSFEVRSGRGQKALTLRGLVMFQWRHAGRVLEQAQRFTLGGHESLAGAEPPRYTSATCTIG